MRQLTFTPNTPNFEWIGRDGGRKVDADISISEVKQGVHIIFRNETREIIGERVQFAIMKNRLYLKSDEHGLKLYDAKKTKRDNGYIKISSPKHVPQFRAFIGDYQLRHDDFYDLYYIEREAEKPRATVRK